MMQNILISAMASLGAVAALYVAFAFVLARLWCKPKRLPLTKSPADFDMAFERVKYFSHGIAIGGWFIPAQSNAPQQPAIILAHGWCNNAVEMLPLAQLLRQAGFALLLYDARGHGASGDDGPITILKLAEDIVAAVDYLEGRPDVDKKRLGVLGRSIGGSAAILAAAMDQRIQAIASCSAFADPKTLTKNFLQMKHIPAGLFAPAVFRFIEGWLGTSMDSVAPQNRITDITSPLLLIHGEKDSYIKPSNMELLHSRSSQRGECLLIPGRGHSDVMRDPLCTQEIVSFFERNLHPIQNQMRSVTLPGIESWPAR